VSLVLGRDVVLDACVLAPMHLRNLLFTASEVGLFRARWSNLLLDELRRTLKTDLRVTDEQIDHLLGEMRRFFPDAGISDFEHLIPAIDNEAEDRHVLAAAIRIGAARIVTENLKDFRSSLLEEHDLTVVSSDEFLIELMGHAPRAMVDALQMQIQSYVRRPITLPELLERLRRTAPGFVADVQSWLENEPRSSM
jgi:hypothetical protein